MSTTFWQGDGTTHFERFVAKLADAADLNKVERVEVDEVRGSPDWLFEASALAGEGDQETCAGIGSGRTPGEAKYNLARGLLALANAHVASVLGETYRPMGEADSRGAR